MAGNHSAWPVYLTVGNIPKHVRKRPSANAVLLLALLPKFPKSNNTASTRAEFHRSLASVFQPLQDVLAQGLDPDCAEGFVRRCFQRLAAWMVDTLEQSLLTSVIRGLCPVCTLPESTLGDQGKQWPTRVPKNKGREKTMIWMRRKRETQL
jgi:hypothetical protein